MSKSNATTMATKTMENTELEKFDGNIFHKSSQIKKSNAPIKTKLISNLPGNVTLEITRNIFFIWDSHHARLKSHCKTWSYKKKKHKEIKPYRKDPC